MFKKNKKQTETIKEPKEKKVRTVKVGTHKKAVIALWVVLIASVSFGVYKNFTAIDQHTTHEKEIIELRLQDTNGIENFVKNFAKSYYTWSNSKEAIEARTQAINGYLTKELQDLNVDMDIQQRIWYRSEKKQPWIITEWVLRFIAWAAMAVRESMQVKK